MLHDTAKCIRQGHSMKLLIELLFYLNRLFVKICQVNRKILIAELEENIDLFYLLQCLHQLQIKELTTQWI